MVDTSWAERRRRMVKCKIHGLHFDPEMSTGCARCLKEAAKAQPRSSPQLVLILLCILGMAGILFYVFGPGQEKSDVIDLGMASSPAAAEKLDPEPYRGQVESLETALFLTRIEETGDLLIVSGDIAAAAGELSSSILESDPTGGLAAADLIARLGQSIPTDQVVQRDVETAQSQWLRIRKHQLQPADWFFSPPPPASPSAAEYSDVAASLRSSIEDGLEEVQGLAEATAVTTPGAADPVEGDPVGGDPVEGWRSFARDWRQQLDRLESRLPTRPPASADGRMLAAIQDLDLALGRARALAAATSPPDAADARFDDAIDAALKAQQGFDELVR